MRILFGTAQYIYKYPPVVVRLLDNGDAKIKGILIPDYTYYWEPSNHLYRQGTYIIQTYITSR